ncbi:MAG: flagellar hook-associated protein FlgL [Fimbriimonas ginsengisoli]|uniref:Flagellar hook-associated protein FlgL n=1 Tax=Fimbriimonas ginsengisoli TaxID=1005039 RepID=A0A931LTA3_FIMGI|nr:flagellar hook-associated protein FlgL [Fimbriimonas ginsengisoli]
MRISTSQQFDTFSANIAVAAQQMFEAQQRVSTGRRLNQLSDDPVGASSALTMRSLRTGLSQYSSNLHAAKGMLGYSDTAMGETTNLLNRAYQLALAGANSATDQAGRAGMASEIAGIQSRLVDLANSKGPNGQYLFGGQKNAAPPYAVNAGALTYSGDTNDVVVEVGPLDTMAATTQASTIFTDAYAQLENLKNNLASGNVGAIGGLSVADMQSSLQAVSLARGTIGGKLRTVDEFTSQNDRRSNDLTVGISDVEDADIAESVVKYQAAKTAYDAALNVASQGFGLSLLNFMK